MSECTHDCASCSVDCESRKPESLLEESNKLSNIKKVIGVVSGKGGVGKSLGKTVLKTPRHSHFYQTLLPQNSHFSSPPPSFP